MSGLVEVLRDELAGWADGLASDSSVPAAVLFALSDDRLDVLAGRLQGAVLVWFTEHRLVSVPREPVPSGVAVTAATSGVDGANGEVS